MINIRGIDKAKILKALYEGSAPMGMGVLKAKEEPITLEECRELLKTQGYFDYLHGRPLKVALDTNTFDPRLYDRDNGEGAAEFLINEIIRKENEAFFRNQEKQVGVTYKFSKTLGEHKLTLILDAKTGNGTTRTIREYDYFHLNEYGPEERKDLITSDTYSMFQELIEPIIEELQK